MTENKENFKLDDEDLENVTGGFLSAATIRQKMSMKANQNAGLNAAAGVRANVYNESNTSFIGKVANNSFASSNVIANNNANSKVGLNAEAGSLLGALCGEPEIYDK